MSKRNRVPPPRYRVGNRELTWEEMDQNFRGLHERVRELEKIMKLKKRKLAKRVAEVQRKLVKPKMRKRIRRAVRDTLAAKKDK